MKIQKWWNLLVLVAVIGLILPALAWAYPAEVPRTGQTTCYDTVGAVTGCTGTGQDGDIQAGAAWPSPRFIDNGDGTVTDSLTGLEWTKDANPAGGYMTWQDALDYVKTLNTGGRSDWRLPNVNELESLLNAELFYPALPSNNPFINVQSYIYWSSTSVAYNTSCAWMVDMDWGGSFGYYGKGGYGFWVWPVRSGQCGALDNSVICLPKTGQTKCYMDNGTEIDCTGTGQDGDIQAGAAWPSPRFIDNGDGTVTDSLTCLMWTKDANPASATKKWQQALDYVKTLNTGGHSDWRLPNRRELRSLADYTRYNPALPQDHPFTNVQSHDYWSSTSYAQIEFDRGFAWIMDMGDCEITGGNKIGIYYGYVWPVRAGQCGSFDNLVIAQTPFSGPPGTTFAQWGTGGTPNGPATLHFSKYDGTEQGTLPLRLDRSGHFETHYNSSYNKPAGMYIWWVVDETTHESSNVVSYEITGDTFPSGVDVIDPQASGNDFLSSFYNLQGKASALYEAMAKGGQINNLRFIAADGVTKFIIRAKVAGAGQVNFTLDASDRGTVGAIDGSGGQSDSFSMQAVQTTKDGWKAYAVYTAPADFTTNTNDNTVSKSVLLSVMYKKDGESSIITLPGGDIDIMIVRPPVVLVHGLWSSQDAFIDQGFRLQQAYPGNFYIYPIDYSADDGAAKSFDKNLGKIKTQINSNLKGLRNWGIAVTQVDYLGHSMGGVLGRLVSQDDKESINYYKGNIHKLITIDTPHTGSPWPSFIDGMHGFFNLYNPSVATEFIVKTRVAGYAINLGAIDDLMPCSQALKGQKKTQQFASAIVGDYTGNAEPYKNIPILKIARGLKWMGFLDFPESWDLIVKTDSQIGGISSDAFKTYNHVHMNGLGDLPSWGKSSFVTSRLVELLNSSVSSSSFDSFPAVSELCESGLGAPQLISQRSVTPSQHMYAAPSSPTDPYMEITSPAQGQTFNSGDVVPVTLTAYNATLTKALIVSKGNLPEIDAEPFTANITIPANFLGDFEIGAVGIASDNSVLIANDITINVEAGATLAAIVTTPERVFIDVGDTAQLVVNGLYSDNITRNITASATGTTYASNNEAIATVSTSGNISGVAVGTANITITNGTVSALMPVTVSEPPAPLSALVVTDNITTLTGTDQLPLSVFITSGTDNEQNVQYSFTLTFPDNSTTPLGAATPLTLAAHASWSQDSTLTLPLNGAGWYTLTFTATNDTDGQAEAKFDFIIESTLITTTTTTSISTTTTSLTTTTTQLTSTTTGPSTTTTPATTTAVTSTTTLPTTTTTTTTGGPCPAKTTLGADNPKLQQLRDFRDSTLAQSAIGRQAIQIYYNNADSINAALERSPALRSATRQVLEVIAPMVGE